MKVGNGVAVFVGAGVVVSVGADVAVSVGGMGVFVGGWGVADGEAEVSVGGAVVISAVGELGSPLPQPAASIKTSITAMYDLYRIGMFFSLWAIDSFIELDSEKSPRFSNSWVG